MAIDEILKTRRLRFDPLKGCLVEVKSSVDRFIKGPIPLKWVIAANSLPGKCGSVGVALWYLSGLNNSKQFKVTSDVERVAGCERKAVYSALNELENNGLICVVRRKGARPLVTILNF